MFRRAYLLMAFGATFGSVTSAQAQSEERYAFVPSRPIERTADDANMGFRSSSVPGMLELAVPKGTSQVDILNARGKVVHSYMYEEIEVLDLGTLSRGTWTLRAHTPHGFSVRRFVVMQPGSVAWAVPRSGRRN